MEDQQEIKVKLNEMFTICIVDDNGCESFKQSYFFDPSTEITIDRNKTKYELKGLSFKLT